MATANIITDAAAIADNITVTGATPLTLGSLGVAYAVPTGMIDASGTAAGGGYNRVSFLYSWVGNGPDVPRGTHGNSTTN